MTTTPRDQAARALFEDWAIRYDETIGPEFEKTAGISFDAFFRGLLDRLAPVAGEEVLDAATGTGLVAVGLAREHGCRVTGLDASAEMLARAEESIARAAVADQVELVRGEAESLPFDDDRFAAATMSLAIHHTDVPRVLDELVRVIRPGGLLVISDFLTPRTWRTVHGRLLVPVYRFAMRYSRDPMVRADVGYAAIHTRRWWERRLAERGLEILDLEAWPRSDDQWEPVPFTVEARR